MMAGGLDYPLVCGSHGPITYYADGTYVVWGQVGTWRLEDSILTETTTHADPMHVDVPPEEIGKPVSSTLRWADQNAFLKRYTDGQVRAFRRCPDTR